MTSGDGTRRHGNFLKLIGAGALATAVIGTGVASGDGGIGAPQGPVLDDSVCVERCLGARTVTETGRARVTGENLDKVKVVKLKGESGRFEVEPKRVRSDRVDFVVPRGTISAKPVVVDRYGSSARSPVELEVAPEDEISESEGFRVRELKTTPSKSFYDGSKRSRIDYLFEADGPTDIRIDVLRGNKRKLVDTMIKRDRDPYSSQSAKWDGLTDSGRIAPNGKYRFEVSQLSGGPGARDPFHYYDHIFPLRAPHQYGDGLGAGRNHQGQDVFAECGKKVVAARGGTVQTKQYHSSAGYYMVIDGRKTGKDYVYMHLERKGRPKLGSRVKTGDVIGYNSDTGNASGCHVHFELWSSPGWYEGGHVLDPTPVLKRWDRWS